MQKGTQFEREESCGENVRDRKNTKNIEQKKDINKFENIKEKTKRYGRYLKK